MNQPIWAGLHSGELNSNGNLFQATFITRRNPPIIRRYYPELIKLEDGK